MTASGESFLGLLRIPASIIQSSHSQPLYQHLLLGLALVKKGIYRNLALFKIADVLETGVWVPTQLCEQTGPASHLNVGSFGIFFFF